MGAAVVVVVGCGGVVVVVVGLGSGGQGHVARSGWVGPLVQPSQLGHVTRDITRHVTRVTRDYSLLLVATLPQQVALGVQVGEPLAARAGAALGLDTSRYTA